MRIFWAFIFSLFGLLLPFHGLITVILPSQFRWWKEVLLGILLLGVIVCTVKKLMVIPSPAAAGGISKSGTNHDKYASARPPIKLGVTFIKNLKQEISTWTWPEIFAKLFLVYLMVLAFVHPEGERAWYAVRYLGMFTLVFLLTSRLLHYWPKKRQITVKEVRSWKQEVINTKLFKILNSKFQLPTSCATFPTFFDFFAHHFLAGCMLSIAFGTWLKLGNGVEVMSEFYSHTISSWVPGQTLPLWHEVAGIPRMQGTSSGPIEFSHLLLLCLALVPRLWFRDISRFFIVVVLLYGIWMSYSRAALLGAIIILISWGYEWWCIRSKTRRRGLEDKKTRRLEIESRTYYARWRKIFKRLAVAIPILLALFFAHNFYASDLNNVLHPCEGRDPQKYMDSRLHGNEEKQKFCMLQGKLNSTWNRVGTSDHITRPLQVLEETKDHTWFGRLGEIGPAARNWNLKHFNNDQALIAENVFVDIYGQTGRIGLGLVILFWLGVIFSFPGKLPVTKWWVITTNPWRMWGICLALFVVMNLATIFDMTPLSISYGILFAFLLRLRQN